MFDFKRKLWAMHRLAEVHWPIIFDFEILELTALMQGGRAGCQQGLLIILLWNLKAQGKRQMSLRYECLATVSVGFKAKIYDASFHRLEGWKLLGFFCYKALLHFSSKLSSLNDQIWHRWHRRNVFNVWQMRTFWQTKNGGLLPLPTPTSYEAVESGKSPTNFHVWCSIWQRKVGEGKKKMDSKSRRDEKRALGTKKEPQNYLEDERGSFSRGTL